MVDWGIAGRVARFAARSDHRPDLGVDMPALARELEPPVLDFARLPQGPPAPPAEVVGRVGWAEANLQSLAGLLDPVAQRLDDRLEGAGPFAGALRLGAGVTLSAEVGLVTGYMAQRVLGQYELSLLAPEAPARLLFVAPNLHGAAAQLGADRESFLRWVAIHELVHALQFGGVPWLREHLAGLLRSFLATVDVRIERGTGRFARLPRPVALVERFREGGLAALVQTAEQRALMAQLQATMAMVEGHAEHVMDALAPALVPAHEGLREALDLRRRSRSTPELILQRLLGMDLKLRQYELGKEFCDAVVREGGIELLNRAWESSAALPGLDELGRPSAWIVRVGDDAPAFAA